MPLSVLQERFVFEYLTAPENASKAARKAGYSAKAARTTASKLLKHSKLVEAIQLEQKRLKKRYQIDINFLAERLLSIINSNQSNVPEQIDAIRELGMLFGCYPKK